MKYLLIISSVFLIVSCNSDNQNYFIEMYNSEVYVYDELLEISDKQMDQCYRFTHTSNYFKKQYSASIDSIDNIYKSFSSKVSLLEKELLEKNEIFLEKQSNNSNNIKNYFKKVPYSCKIKYNRLLNDIDYLTNRILALTNDTTIYSFYSSYLDKSVYYANTYKNKNVLNSLLQLKLIQISLEQLKIDLINSFLQNQPKKLEFDSQLPVVVMQKNLYKKGEIAEAEILLTEYSSKSQQQLLINNDTISFINGLVRYKLDTRKKGQHDYLFEILDYDKYEDQNKIYQARLFYHVY